VKKFFHTINIHPIIIYFVSRDRSSVTVNNIDHCQYFRKYFRLNVLLAWILADRIDRREFCKMH